MLIRFHQVEVQDPRASLHCFNFSNKAFLWHRPLHLLPPFLPLNRKPSFWWVPNPFLNSLPSWQSQDWFNWKWMTEGTERLNEAIMSWAKNPKGKRLASSWFSGRPQPLIHLHYLSNSHWKHTQHRVAQWELDHSAKAGEVLEHTVGTQPRGCKLRTRPQCKRNNAQKILY